jgi:hypothetical protein
MTDPRKRRFRCRLELEVLEHRDAASVLFGLTDNNFLVRFNSAAPAVINHVALISGLQAGERIVGIDFRPRTGQLFGVGIVDGSTDTLRLYTINPLTGAASLVPGSTSIVVTDGASYGVDFNPTVDRIRVVNDADENLRLNPNNGARADSPTNDTDLSPAANQIEGVAYDRNFDSGLAVANRTTLYGISAANSSLVTIGGINQSPSPNGGAVMNSQSLGVTLSASGEVAFDIAAGSSTGLALLRSNATGATGLYSINLSTGGAALLGTVGNGFTKFAGLAAVPDNTVVTGNDAGAAANVRVFDGFTNLERFSISPYGTFAGGVRVATADVTLDGIPDIITGPGPGGGPHVRVFNGANGAQVGGPLGSFFAFNTNFTGGVHVAGGDINGDGNKDVIVGADAGGGPHVRVFSGATGAELVNFFAYPSNFTGGVRVASADFDRDGDYEIITAAGAGGGPHIRVFDGSGAPFTSSALPSFVNSFFAYGTFSGGVYVAAGDVSGDGVPEIVTGAGSGGGPHVKAFSGVNGALVDSFFAYEGSFTGGVRVGVADFNADGRYDIRTIPGPGRLTEERAFDGLSQQQLESFLPYPGTSGAFIGGARF